MIWRTEYPEFFCERGFIAEEIAARCELEPSTEGFSLVADATTTGEESARWTVAVASSSEGPSSRMISVGRRLITNGDKYLGSGICKQVIGVAKLTDCNATIKNDLAACVRECCF